MTESLSCFKAYDIRGKVPQDLDEELSYKIGYAYASILKPGKVIVGYDVRLESPALASALITGLHDGGSEVINIGICGTEEVYYHTFSKEQDGVGGGIMVTASHNPKGYNGLKLVKKGSRPISLQDDLQTIKDYIIQNRIDIPQQYAQTGIIKKDKSDYINYLMKFINPGNLKPLKIVVNPGNGPAGAIIKHLEKHLPFQFIYVHEEPDGNFPNGVPNPMIPVNRKVTSDAVLKHNANFGVAWDGDFDRCFLFDEKGNFIEGYYLVALLAKNFLAKNKKSKIIHDPRLTWNTIVEVEKNGGEALQSRCGHSFIKEKMRTCDAIYGGEMSAHHYFRDFAYCDSGMIPWLLIAEQISTYDTALSEMISDMSDNYPISGEINYKIENADEIMKNIENHYKTSAITIDYIDGISMEFEDWRFNIRKSNTEPLLRLNLETRQNPMLVKSKLSELEKFIFNTS